MRSRLWMLPRAVLRLTVLGLRLRWFGFGSTERWLNARRPIEPSEFGSADDAVRAADWVRAVERAARLSPRKPACLTRSLTLWSLLRDEAISSRVCVGARQVHSGLLAHAWVEYGGQVLNDDLDIACRFPPLGS